MKIDLYISNEAPNVSKGSAWLKPVAGGFALYVLNNGWEPLKLNSEEDVSSATVKTAVSKVKSDLVGKSGDAATEMTLYGLKAYIDEQLSSLGTGEEIVSKS